MPTSTVKKKKVSTARQWKRKKFEEVDLPSGNTCLAKRPGPELFLAEGVMPDTLTPIIRQAINTGKGLPPQKVKEMVKDPAAVMEMMDAVDRVTAKVVVEPQVMYHKNEAGEIIPDDERDDEKYIYTDEIDLEDKLFLFNFAVGGTRDLERFRKQHSASVGDVQSV